MEIRNSRTSEQITAQQTPSLRTQGGIRSHHGAPPASRASTDRLKTVAQAFQQIGQALPRLLPKKPVTLGVNNFYSPIGVAGGMGTLAGIDLTQRIAHKAAERLSGKDRTDQNAPVINLESRAPEIQDRTNYLLTHGVAELSGEDKAAALTRRVEDNPLFGIKNAIRRLDKAGARVYAVPCNTAHAWAPYFTKASKKMKFVHIVDAALKNAIQNPVIKAKLDAGDNVRIGLLATTGTVKNRIYQDRLAELASENRQLKQIEFVLPDNEVKEKPEDDVQKELVMKGIYDPKEGVKGNNLEAGGNLLRKATEHLIEKGVDAVSLSCTEIPLVVKQEHFPDTPLIDATDALADEVVNVSMELRKQELAEKAKPGLAQRLSDKLKREPDGTGAGLAPQGA